jgi:hypothetical protein
MKSTPHPAPTSERTGKLTKLLHKKLIRICTNMSGLVNNATANTNDDRTESEFTSVSDGGAR